MPEEWGPGRGPEVLGSWSDDGGDHGEGPLARAGRGIRERAGRQWRERPRAVVALVAAVLVPVVGVGGWIGYRSLQGPPLPVLTGSELLPSSGAPQSEAEMPFVLRPDGRPSPLRLIVRLRPAFGDLPGGGVDLLGLTGPGISPGGSPTHVSTPRPAAVTLVGSLDCGAAGSVPADGAGLGFRVRVRDGSRESLGVLPVGAAGPALAAEVDSLCGIWLALRDLTVTAAAGTVDPVTGVATQRVTITHAGPRPAYVIFSDETSPASDAVVRRAEVGARSSTTITLHRVTPDGCGPDLAPADPAVRYRDTSSLLPLSASAARAARTLELATLPSRRPAIGLTGLVMTGPAAAQAESVRSALCAGTDDPLVQVHGQVGLAAGTVTVPVEITVTRGTVSDIVLPPRPASSSAPLLPRWTVARRLVPDRSGRVATTLTFQLSPDACRGPADEPVIVPLVVDQHVQGTAGDRTVRATPIVPLPIERQSLVCSPA